MKLTGLVTANGSFGVAVNARTLASDDRLAKRLSAMQDGLQQLQNILVPKATAKQGSMSKVAWLKKRLEMLKAMLLHASPEQAKALARELKGIAKELQSVAKSLGGGGQGGSSVPAAGDVATATTSGPGNPSAEGLTTADAASSAVVGDASDSESAPAQGTDDKLPSEADSTTSASGHMTESGQMRQGGDDEDLRAALKDVKKLLKEVIGMVKAKLALAANEAKASREEKQAKLDVESAEKSLSYIENAVSQRGSNDFYTALGELGSGGVTESFAASVAVDGSNVNVSA
jgi:hypothetical protein